MEMKDILDMIINQNNPDAVISAEELDNKSNNINEKWQQCKGADEMEKLYTPGEVEEYLHFSPKTIKDYLRAKKIRGIKIGNVNGN